MATIISRRLGLAPIVHTRAFSQSLSLLQASPSNSRYTSEQPRRRDPTFPKSLFQGSRQDPPYLRESADSTRPTQPRVYPQRPTNRPPPTPHEYLARRATLKKRFPDGWDPPRKISHEAMEALRELNARDPVQYRTPVLATKFRISPEAVSKILKSKWKPKPERKAKLIARDHKTKDMWVAGKMREERDQAVKSLEGRLDLSRDRKERE